MADFRGVKWRVFSNYAAGCSSFCLGAEDSTCYGDEVEAD